MKKYILVFSLFLFLMPFLVLAQPETTVESNGVTLGDLEVTNPGLLPTSNFYFFKKFVRGLQRVVTFNAVSRAELELKIVNEKAAELKKVSENNTDKKALEKAIANYKENAERLRARLEALKETSENPNVDKLLDKLADRTLKHQQMFEELKEKHETVREKIEAAQETLNETAADAAERLDTAEKLKERFQKAVENQREVNAKEIRAVGILDKIEERVKDDAVKVKLSEAKDELIKKFDERVNKRLIAPSAVPQLLETLPITETQKLRILEQVKERTKNAEVKVRLENIEGKIREAVKPSIKPEPSPIIICTREYDPVCGANGKTYGNACEARVAGVAIKAKGECPAAEVRTETKPAPAPAPTNLSPSVTAVPAARKWSVAVKNGAFSPAEVKIRKGDTVVWTVEDSTQAWPVSAVHPTHEVYPGFDAGTALNQGQSYSFTFDKVGSWKYHNHLNPSVTGIVEVSE